MRYQEGRSYGIDVDVTIPMYWAQELYIIDSKSFKLDLEVNDQGNLCIVGGRNKFVYAEIDKDGVMHIKNSAYVWLNKKVLALIRITLMTAYGLDVYLYPARYLPTIEVAKEYNPWENRVKYLADDESEPEIRIYPNGRVEGARTPKKKSKTTSTW